MSQIFPAPKRCFPRLVAATVLLLSIVLMIERETPLHAETPQGFPQAWHGIWGLVTDECFAKDWGSSDSLFKVSGLELTGWEWGCKVTRVVSKDGATLAIDLACSGETGEWTTRELWGSGEIDGKKLLVMVPLNDNQQIRIYRRCQ